MGGLLCSRSLCFFLGGGLRGVPQLWDEEGTAVRQHRGLGEGQKQGALCSLFWLRCRQKNVGKRGKTQSI